MDNTFEKVSECKQYPMNHEKMITEKFNDINQNKKPYALITANIKSFKYLNMKYGWGQGNEILHLIYLSLAQKLSEGEYLAHIAADNFVLLLHSDKLYMEEDETRIYAQTVMMKLVDAIFNINDERIDKNLYASFGIYPAGLRPCSYYEAIEITEFFRKEEPGIKHRTFSLNFYHENIHHEYMQNYELKKSTANALLRGEYKVYIQPKVDVKTSTIVGGEALLRRFGADGKPINLNEFLPILNEEGYIRKVDWFVFETVCEELSTRFTDGKPVVPISFNISKSFFNDIFMCENYIKTHKKYNIPQTYIEFELMETISLDDTDRMTEVISKFKQAGFRCSLDDFGNGYSSFGVLLNADFDYIKLDRIFFINQLDDTSRKILKSIVDMLKFLGLKIVAEGVETKEHVDYLAEIGCDIIQGYYFYRPMPMEEFLQLLDKQEDTKQSKMQGNFY